MNIIARIFTGLLFLCPGIIAPVLAQQSYFLSNSGNDSLDGSSPETAWASVYKLNSVLSGLQPGDRVLFQRGSVFRNQLNLIASGSDGNPILFGVYGSGEKPQINGSVEVRDWEKIGENIYKAYYSGLKLTNLFINGRQMILARYPNKGFLTISTANGNSGFKCNGLDQESQYWKGANVRLRTENWVWEARKVKSYVSGTIVFDSPTAYSCDNGWGFYLDGKLEELDADYEWYWDPVTQFVYVFLPVTLDPSDCLIEASALDYGISGSVHHVKIENLAVLNQSKVNIDLKGDYNSILNCTARNAWETAISVNGNNLSVDSNYVSTLSGRGIFGYNNRNISVSHNQIKNIGLVEGYGRTGDGAYKGLFLDHCQNAVVMYNRLDSIGYAGINIYGSYSLAEKNIIDHAMLILDDGAALYGWGNYTHHNIWRNNIIYNAIGSGKAKANNERMALAIYLDNGFDSSLVINNTVINCQGGILNNADANYNTFIGNTVFGKSGGISFANWGYPDAPILGCQTKGNVFYTTGELSMPLSILFNVKREIGEFDSNYYFNPYKNFYFPGGRSFDDWNGYFDDKGSKISFFHLNDVTVQVAEIFVNETDTLKSISLADNTYLTLDSIMISKIDLLPYSSRILINYKKLSEVTDVKKIRDSGIKIFPNPCLHGQYVNIRLLETSSLPDISVFDSMGRLLVRYRLTGSQSEFSFSTDDFPSGLYWINIIQDNRSTSQSLLIQ